MKKRRKREEKEEKEKYHKNNIAKLDSELNWSQAMNGLARHQFVVYIFTIHWWLRLHFMKFE